MRTDDRFNEIAQKVINGEMRQVDAANELGMPFTTFRYNLDKAFPDRKKGSRVRKDLRQYPNGTGRPKTTETVLESLVTDRQMCAWFFDWGYCDRCPLNGGGVCESHEGLVKALLQKVPKRHV